jgi:hypothetical protein
MVSNKLPLLLAALLLVLSMAPSTEAVARLQVESTAAAHATATTMESTAAVQATTTNQALAVALAKLLRNNGTHMNVTIQPPFLFNATTRTDTLKMAGQLLQQLLKAQPLLNMLQQVVPSNGNLPARTLLGDDDNSNDSPDVPASSGTGPNDTDAKFSPTTKNDTTSKSPTEITNGRKLASRINIIMSDAWLVAFSGFRVAQVSFQLLAAMLSAGASGTVTVDTSLILKFADVSSNFLSSVSYLLYSIQKLTAGAVSPLGLVKPVAPPAPLF